jgi:hypothetical protein
VGADGVMPRLRFVEPPRAAPHVWWWGLRGEPRRATRFLGPSCRSGKGL